MLLTLVSFNLGAINYDGALVTLGGDTIHCQIQFSDSNPHAYKGEILSTRKITAVIDGKKMTYAADELRNYNIRVQGNWKTYWGVNTKNKKYQFMKQEVKGKLTLYSGVTYYAVQLKFPRHYVFIKTESSEKLYLEQGTASNRQKLTRFIAECPVASGLIYSGVIDLGIPSHWQRVAQAYNEQC